MSLSPLSPLSHMKLKGMSLLARGLVGIASSSSTLLSARPLLPSFPSRSYSAIEPIPRVKYTSKSTLETPRYPKPQPTQPFPFASSPATPPSPSTGSETTPTPDPAAPVRPTTALERYFKRGLPNWLVGFICLYWFVMYFYESAAGWGLHDGAQYADRAKKMERATAARDAYFAKIEAEKEAIKEAIANGTNVDEVSFLPGSKVVGTMDVHATTASGKGEDELKEIKDGKRSWWSRRLI